MEEYFAELEKGQQALNEVKVLLIGDAAHAIVPFFANDVFAVSDKVAFDRASNNYEVDGRMFFERWWFKAA